MTSLIKSKSLSRSLRTRSHSSIRLRLKSSCLNSWINMMSMASTILVSINLTRFRSSYILLHFISVSLYCSVFIHCSLNKYESYYGPGRECTQQLQQLAIVRTLSWLAGMLWLAVTVVACTYMVYANYVANYWKIWDGRSVGNVSTNVCAKFRCPLLRIKKALGIFGPLENW